MLRTFFLVTLCCITSLSFSAKLPPNKPVNGGIAIVPVLMSSKPIVYYRDKPVSVIKSSSKNLWLIVVGIDADAKKPIQYLNVISPQKGKIPFHINQKAYRVQHIKLSNNKKVTLSEEAEQRVTQEKEEINQIIQSHSEDNPFTQKFIAPVRGRLSSRYGLKRIYNGHPRNRHLALDIAAPSGTAVHATANGHVIATGDFFYTGNTVFIEHGQGLISLYAHLNKMTVKPGEPVKRGDIIGRVGSTGRATGPHLHWGMMLNQIYIDPLLFVSTKQIKPKARVKKHVQ